MNKQFKYIRGIHICNKVLLSILIICFIIYIIFINYTNIKYINYKINNELNLNFNIIWKNSKIIILSLWICICMFIYLYYIIY